MQYLAIPQITIHVRSRGHTFQDVWHQLVDNVLHGSVEADVLQRMGLVDDAVALWTCVPLLQVLYQTALAD